ncbi:ribosome small subunit-dependent GTPase A [Liberiplasma polymorphum]|uniref:ribosome small subunit-dependent GTPase A n=1 Tax=Liberiplasma polymorphum TaxID=3374570 RepID=UPI0037708432
MQKGRIIKLIGGQYTVLDDQKKRRVLKPLGVFRHRDISPKVGDIVDFDEDSIHHVYERSNNLVRPPVANVDQAIILNAAKEPDFSFHLLDRFLVLVEKEDVTPVIVVSKIDLLKDEELSLLKQQLTYYETMYDVYFTSVKQDDTLVPLKNLLKDKISVFAGQTGSGKSSLLNALDIKLKLETGEISKALGRGRHTTRHSELLELYGGLVADTPGFSKLDFYQMDIDDLPVYYPDFFERSKDCKFRGCHHINEPSCAVKKAVDSGEILKARYQNYLLIYEEISTIKKKY